MVRQLVVASGHIKETIRAIGDPVPEHKGNDSSHIALYRGHHQIGQNPHPAGIVLLIVGQRTGTTGRLGRSSNPHLQLAHPGDILIQLELVASPQLLLQRVRVREDIIQHALAITTSLLLLRPGRRGIIPRIHSVKHHLRIDLLLQGRGGCGPRDIADVGAAVSRVAVPHVASPLRAQLHGFEERVRSEFLRCELVHRDPIGNPGAFRLHHRMGRQAPRRAGSMATGALGTRGVVSQPTD